jgi:hypothetical protein
VKVGFALQDSNFALQPDFPVFLGNALNWVTESTPVLVRGLGTVEVPLRGAQVRDGSGKPVAVSPTDRGVVFEAPRADVYTVSAPVLGEQVLGRQVLVAANVADPDYALINRTRLAEAAAAPVAESSSAGLWNMELWMLLLLLAGALLLIDWAALTRRFTA